MDLTNLYALSAGDAARLIRDGVISSEQYVGACLARVEEVDKDVQAWAFLDREYAVEQARQADRWRGQGNPLGPLHGVPVGIKDIIDTADMPTENGSVLHAGRTPSRDASVVARLRGAGAVIMGKTVTTEFASGASGKTQKDGLTMVILGFMVSMVVPAIWWFVVGGMCAGLLCGIALVKLQRQVFMPLKPLKLDV